MALVCGIDVRRVQALTFGLGAAMAGAAGNLLVFIFAVNPTIGPSFLLKSFAIIVIGGLGSLLGSYLGAALIFILPIVLRMLPPALCDCGERCAAAFERAREAQGTWPDWLAARDACCVGRAHRYGDDQLAYHYTKNPDHLR